MLGIPAMQLEIPRSVRALLMYNDMYMIGMAKAILNTYQEVICPYWERKKTDVLINTSYCKLVQETKLNYRYLHELSKEYKEWDVMCQDILI